MNTKFLTFSLLVHLPYIGVHDRQYDKATRVVPEEWLESGVELGLVVHNNTLPALLDLQERERSLMGRPTRCKGGSWSSHGVAKYWLHSVPCAISCDFEFILNNKSILYY